MKYALLLITAMILSACGQIKGPAGETGAQGDTGGQGEAGSTGVQGSTGNTGPVGAQGPGGSMGATGATGSTGAAGTDGTSVTTVQLCPGYTTTYPSVFAETAMCITGNLFAVYWDGHNAWLTEIPPGSYSSTSSSAPCSFTVVAGCQVQ